MLEIKLQHHSTPQLEALVSLLRGNHEPGEAGALRDVATLAIGELADQLCAELRKRAKPADDYAAALADAERLIVHSNRKAAAIGAPAVSHAAHTLADAARAAEAKGLPLRAKAFREMHDRLEASDLP